jgi:hypothetical protein
MTERVLSFSSLSNMAQNLGILGWARVFGIASLVGTMLSLPLTNAFAALARLVWTTSH